MKPGIGIELPGWLDMAGRVDLAVRAQEMGLSFITAPEVADPDAFVVSALVAQAAPRLDVGTCIAQIGPRTVPMLASSAATVANLAPGRFTLGIGVSTEAIVSGWHGLAWEHPLSRASESIAMLRKLFRGEATKEEGRAFRSKGYRLGFPPGEGGVPIWLAALGERMVALAASQTEGIWLNLVPRNGVAWVASMVTEHADHRRPRPAIGLPVLVHATDDPRATHAEIAGMLSFYMSSPVYRRSLARHGFDDEVLAAEQAMAARDRRGLVASVSERLIEALTLVGTPSRIRAGVEEYMAAGLTHFVVAPLNQAGVEPALAAISPLLREVAR
jgi:probable F420-dependent oxidoreductase